MKINFIQNNNLKITALAIILTLSGFQKTHAFDDDFEVEFIKKMHTLEKNIQAAFREFNHDIDAAKTINTPLDDIIQKNLADNKDQVTYYQQSSSALSFANKEKLIKISEHNNNNTIKYTIDVTDKNGQKRPTPDLSEKTAPEEFDLHADTTDNLKQLKIYMEKHFNSKQAMTILDDCIDALSQENNTRLINLESTCNEQQKIYSIEVTPQQKTSLICSEKKSKNKVQKNS